jgi:hypothetical protein
MPTRNGLIEVPLASWAARIVGKTLANPKPLEKILSRDSQRFWLRHD